MQFFEADDEVNDLLKDVDEALKRLHDVGDFTPQVAEELAQQFMPESLKKAIDAELLAGRIEDTLAIESIFVNPRVTTSVLEGLALEDVDNYTKQAILNVNQANTFVEHEAREGSPLSERLISQINKLIEEGTGESSKPGTFREIPVSITGAQVQPPHWSEVRDRLRVAINNAEEGGAHPIIVASYLHWAISAIHPFENGNGRTARLGQDFVLIRSGFLPVGIPKTKRNEYYKALQEADLGEGKDLILLVANAQLVMLNKALEIASRPARQEKKISKYVDLINRKSQSTEQKKYEVWRLKTEVFKSEMKAMLDAINEGQGHLQFRYYEEAVPDIGAWQQMLDRGGSPKNQLLRVEVFLDREFVFKFLWYARRHQLQWVGESNGYLRHEVGFFLDIKEQRSEMFSTFNALRDEAYVALREIIGMPGQWLYLQDPRVTGEYSLEETTITLYEPNWTIDKSETLNPIIELFMDSIMRKLGIL
jgi:Fic family protein